MEQAAATARESIIAEHSRFMQSFTKILEDTTCDVQQVHLLHELRHSFQRNQSILEQLLFLTTILTAWNEKDEETKETGETKETKDDTEK